MNRSMMMRARHAHGKTVRHAGLPLAIAMLLAASVAPGRAIAQEAATTPAGQPAPASQHGLVEQLTTIRGLATSGQRSQALAAYDALLQQHPGNGDILLARGRTHAWNGDWAAAESDLLAVTGASPDYADAWSALGDMYLWSDRPQQAADAYRRWGELVRDDPAPHIARGRALRAAGDLAGASEEFYAAGANGAPQDQVDGYLQSLTQRARNPEVFVPEGYRWSATLSASRSWFNHGRGPWNEFTASVRRHFEHGSLAVELLDAQRFGDNDQAWALDAYVDLWQRAYANLRYQQAPGYDLYPGRSWRVELYQGVGQGWEWSASYDRLDFRNTGVDIYGAGLAKYVGNYYLRGRVIYVPDEDEGHSLGFRGQLRYYYAGDGDNYVEVNAGTGYSRDLARGGTGLVDNRNASGSVAWVHYPNQRWGFKLGVGYADDSDGFAGPGVFGSLYRRW